jgi:glycosyltransferase involved in cell wall biosynthesis
MTQQESFYSSSTSSALEVSFNKNSTLNVLEKLNILCFSHLRWDFVYQRPQHLLSRFSRKQMVFFFEEPIHEESVKPHLRTKQTPENVVVVTPVLPNDLSESEHLRQQEKLIRNFVNINIHGGCIGWYYTPLAIRFTRNLSFELVVYDCMDELSHFSGAHEALISTERELLELADLVFTGGDTLYQAKRGLHSDIHSMPSSVDREHFSLARMKLRDPADQADIPHPRAGFFGVLDERLDVELLAQTASLCLDIHFVMIGPVVKIKEESLPRSENIHYLGGKSYKELPEYLANWDVAILPFALNNSTKYISPTKTPEYLAGGQPVVSTPITDVVKPYGNLGLVYIAENAREFSYAIRCALPQKNNKAWKADVDTFLSLSSWDKTWAKMKNLMAEVYQRRSIRMKLAVNY